MRPTLICVFLFLISVTESFSQKVLLKPKMYERFIKRGTNVTVLTFDHRGITRKDSLAGTIEQVPVDKKSVVQYSKNVSVIDPDAYKAFQLASRSKVPRENVIVIPEIHLDKKDSASNDYTSYRIVIASESPFQYDYTLKKFKGAISLFLLPEEGTRNMPISDPISIEIASRNNNIKSDPKNFTIDHLNIPSVPVNLETNATSNSLGINVITMSNPEGYFTPLTVEPGIMVSSNRSTLQGYGIQKIPFEVSLFGPNSNDSVNVNFSTSKGDVSPNPLMMKYNTTALVYLRSEGTGPVKLTAKASINMNSNDLNFQFVFPWVFLLASIIGGLLGSLCRYYLTDSNKKFSGKPIIGGILIGFLGAVAYYALGVNLLGISVSAGLNELAVLGFSALCAYFGIGLVKGEDK